MEMFMFNERLFAAQMIDMFQKAFFKKIDLVL